MYAVAEKTGRVTVKLIHLSLEDHTLSKSISEKNQELTTICFSETGLYEETIDAFKEYPYHEEDNAA